MMQLPNDGAPNAIEALIDLLPCVRGGMKPHVGGIRFIAQPATVLCEHVTTQERKGRVE